jgi:hypothetical protein
VIDSLTKFEDVIEQLQSVIKELIVEVDGYIPANCGCDRCIKTKEIMDKAKKMAEFNCKGLTVEEIEKALEEGRKEKEAAEAAQGSVKTSNLHYKD